MYLNGSIGCSHTGAALVCMIGVSLSRSSLGSHETKKPPKGGSALRAVKSICKGYIRAHLPAKHPNPALWLEYAGLGSVV